MPNPKIWWAVRVWADAHRVISLRHRKIDAARSIRSDLAAGTGPRSSSEFLAALIDRLLDRIVVVVDELDDTVHRLEAGTLDAPSHQSHRQLADARRQGIALRRFISPQRDVLGRLAIENTSWIPETERVRFRELADRLIRVLEELDTAKDRAAVTQEELASRLAENINARLYVLSIVAAVFLPLGLITGIWGVNLGGIPGESHEWGFWFLVGGLAVAAVGQLWLFRKLDWL